MNNFLLWICGLFVVCLGLLFAVPHFVDWNGYRGVIEEEASRYFGRRVRVGGEVNLRVLPVPYVSFDKLSFADTQANTGAPIIRAENFKMWLSVPPLLQGIMEAHHVELRRPVIELVTNENGGGNWESLRLNTRTMTYLPGGFALEALDVTDGQIIVRNASGDERTRFDAINGRLSALAIEGPYKFNGDFQWQGRIQNLRLATSRPSQDGRVQLKASIVAPVSQRKFLLDGVLAAPGGRVAFTGDLTSSLSVSSLTQPTHVSENSSADAGKTSKRTSFDLKSKLTADTRAVALDDINIALQTDGPPQLMLGKAKLDWAEAVAFDVEITSRWIDFDRFLPNGDAGPAPLDTARQLLVALGRALPGQADTNVKIAFDQATLGGEALGAIQLVAVRKAGPLNLREFEASVPGGGKLAISGELSVSKNEPGFKGQLMAEGQSLLRFLRWGLGDEQLATDLSDGPFLLESQVELAENRFALTEATADFGDTPLQGALRVQQGERRNVALDLEGNTINWNRLSSEMFSVGLARKLSHAPGAANASGQEGASADVGTERVRPAKQPASTAGTFAGLASKYDLQLKLKAARLIDRDHVYRDFEGVAVVVDGDVSVPIMRFTRDSGLEVDIGSRASGEARGEKSATTTIIKGLIKAQSRIAIADLLQFLEAGDLDPLLRQRIAALAPLRVAGRVVIGNAAGAKTDVRLAGNALGGRLAANLQFKNGLANWRSAPMDVFASLENEATHKLLSLMSDSRSFARSSKPMPRPGRLYFKAAGIPQAGMLTRAIVEADGLNLGYYGDVALKEGSPAALDGELDVDARDMREAMAVMGVELGDGVKGLPVKGRFGVIRQEETLRLASRNAEFNGENMQGLVTLTKQTNAPTKLIAKVAVARATLPGILGVVLASQSNTAKLEAAPETVSETGVQPVAVRGEDIKTATKKMQDRSVIWPKQNFDLKPLTNIEGYITATFDELAMSADGRLALNNAILEAAVAPGRLSVTKLEGAALGGTTTVAFDIKKAPAGVDLNGKLTMRVGQAGQSSEATAQTSPQQNASEKTKQSEPQSAEDNHKHAATFTLSYEGRAFTPNGLASDLDGSGELLLANASLTGLTAKEVRQVAGDALSAEGPVRTEVFVGSLREKLKDGQVELGSLKLPVTLKDGAIELAPIEISGDDGKTSFESSLAVSTMNFESQWTIAAREPALKGQGTKNTTLLPPIIVAYVGDLSALATVEPRILSGSLERELAVRKMERDVSELERLRKLDEARAREEEERRKELERRLAEQRRQQAEREQQLLLEQQEQLPQLDADGNIIEPTTPDVDGAPVAEAPPPTPSRPRRVRKRPPPKKDVWNPFQITPY